MFNIIKPAIKFANRKDGILKAFYAAVNNLTTLNSEIDEHHARHTSKITQFEEKIVLAKAEQEALIATKTANTKVIEKIKAIVE